MDKDYKDELQPVLETLSVDCFNQCWEYMEKEERSIEDIEEMVLLASTSLWSWKHRSDCMPINLSTAYWQMARVHCLAGNLKLAENYANKNVALSLKSDLPPFFLGYAYENLVQVSVLSNKRQQAKKYLQLAMEQLKLIKIDANKKLLDADLKSYAGVIEQTVKSKVGSSVVSD